MLSIRVEQDRVRIGERFAVSFHRTLRIPDDGRVYPLPPGLGTFPLHPVGAYADRVPPAWQERPGVFLPMYQREALWLGFEGTPWKPNAVKIGIGRINAISGGEWDERLHADPQDYLVCPDQPWLDGINAGHGVIRQFVAMPLGMGYTVEAQLTGREQFGGIQIVVFEPKLGRFPDEPPPPRDLGPVALGGPAPPPSGELGLGAGGRMRQKIYPDPYGIDTWDPTNYGSAFVYLVNSAQYQELTGLAPPSTPISAQTYTDAGLPWFDLYDESRGDLAAAEKLAAVQSIQEQDAEWGPAATEPDPSVDVSESQINKISRSNCRE